MPTPDLAPVEEAFVPNAFIAPAIDPPFWLLAARSPSSQIEGWPRAMFEADAYRPPFPGMPLFIMQPEAIRTVLLDAAEDFPQGDLFKRMMRPAWGNGLLTADDRNWRWQRRAASPAFRPTEIVGLAPLISRVAEAAVERWTETGRADRIDMASEMARLTFDIILDTMLSRGEDFDRAAMRARMQAFFSDIGRMRLSYFLAPDAYHASRPETRSAQRQPLVDAIRLMIARRRGAARRSDLVDLLLHARDPETGLGLDDDVDRLVFTRQVLSETLRLYPPAFLITRVSRKTTELAGVSVKAGSRINIPVYALHRRRGYWPNPDTFEPDRFSPSAEPPDRYVYLPFGGGPRICLGAVFAMMEAVTVLASLVRSADFTVTPGHRVWPVAKLALRPAGGLPMSVVRRD